MDQKPFYFLFSCAGYSLNGAPSVIISSISGALGEAREREKETLTMCFTCYLYII